MHLSIIIPLYNEEENVEPGHAELAAVLNEHYPSSHEIIYVDDGSADRTWEYLCAIADDQPNIQGVKLRRNFGQTAAIAAGIGVSKGEIIVFMDGDMQNDPRDIPALVEKIEREGFDIASGWRKDRKDKAFSVNLPSRLGNFVISLVTGVRLRDYGCTLKAYRGDLIRRVPLYGELHRFIPALVSTLGTKIIEIPVNHRARQFGQSKYSLIKVYKVILDLLKTKFFLTYFSSPIYFFGKLGFLMALPGLVVGGYYTVLRFGYGATIGHKIPSLLFASFSVLSGFLTLMVGLLAELVVQIEYRHNPGSNYIIETIRAQSGEGEAESINAGA